MSTVFDNASFDWRCARMEEVLEANDISFPFISIIELRSRNGTNNYPTVMHSVPEVVDLIGMFRCGGMQIVDGTQSYAVDFFKLTAQEGAVVLYPIPNRNTPSGRFHLPDCLRCFSPKSAV